eukprot:1208960-Rhodomonas_salina.3
MPRRGFALRLPARGSRAGRRAFSVGRIVISNPVQIPSTHYKILLKRPKCANRFGPQRERGGDFRRPPLGAAETLRNSTRAGA